MHRFLLAMLLACLVPLPRASAAEEERLQPDPVGTWRGELAGSTGDGKSLQVVLRLRQDASGIIATIDGLGRELRNLKIESLSLIEDVLSFQVPQVQGRFAGNVYGDSIRGTWSQGDESRPLIFFRD
jgi:hypothetical protein